jgi:type VI secretion system protein ImpK
MTTERASGGLALALQEVFTAAVRLRSNRQVASDAHSFRTQVKQLLAAADGQARQAGYSGDDVRLAVYAVIVFIDESVLSSQLPMFDGWTNRPLQEEIFGSHVGGEIFFDHLAELLRRPDSPEVADVLEVYQLCLLLGLRGKYGLAGGGELAGLARAVGEKISRIRGGQGDLAPQWAAPSGEVLSSLRDPWNRILGLAAACTFAVALVLFIIFKLVLRSGVADLGSLVS